MPFRLGQGRKGGRIVSYIPDPFADDGEPSEPDRPRRPSLKFWDALITSVCFLVLCLSIAYIVLLFLSDP